MRTSDTSDTTPTRSSRYRARARAILATPEGALAVVLVILAAAITLANPTFLTPSNLFNLLRSISITGIVAVGMTFVLVAGDLDLAVGSELALGGLIGVMASAILPWPAAAVLGIVAGATAGLVSALIVTRIGVVSFIATLGMLSVARGLGLFISDGAPQRGLLELTPIGQGRLGPVPIQVVLVFAVVIVGHLVLSRSNFGRQVQAVGDNPEAARLSGIRVARIRIACFLICGGLAALAGLVRTAQLSVAEPNAGIGLELDVIAAVVLGGASLSGGRGSVVGAMLGAVLLGVLRNAFVLLQLSNFLQVISIGVVIVLAAAFDRLRARAA